MSSCLLRNRPLSNWPTYSSCSAVTASLINYNRSLFIIQILKYRRLSFELLSNCREVRPVKRRRHQLTRRYVGRRDFPQRPWRDEVRGALQVRASSVIVSSSSTPAAAEGRSSSYRRRVTDSSISSSSSSSFLKTALWSSLDSLERISTFSVSPCVLIEIGDVSISRSEPCSFQGRGRHKNSRYKQ